MEIAFSYLKVLAESGYFERAHVSGDGVWFKGRNRSRGIDRNAQA
jgi:hypothetical protein